MTVFLLGKYAPSDFLNFIDTNLSNFDFDIEYVYERDQPSMSLTALLK